MPFHAFAVSGNISPSTPSTVRYRQDSELFYINFIAQLRAHDGCDVEIMGLARVAIEQTALQLHTPFFSDYRRLERKMEIQDFISSLDAQPARSAPAAAFAFAAPAKMSAAANASSKAAIFDEAGAERIILAEPETGETLMTQIQTLESETQSFPPIEAAPSVAVPQIEHSVMVPSHSDLLMMMLSDTYSRQADYNFGHDAADKAELESA